MRRFTILGLMGVVLGLAVAIAALRNADDHWAGGLLLAMALLIGIATLGAIYHCGPRRAGRLGFAVFAGGYFALAFVALSEPNLNRLPTEWLLRYVHEKVAPNPIYHDITVVNATRSSSGTISTVSNPVPLQLETDHPSSRPNRWRSMLPGATNYGAFSVVGHCLFALLAGLLGAGIARGCQATQD